MNKVNRFKNRQIKIIHHVFIAKELRKKINIIYTKNIINIRNKSTLVWIYLNEC